MNPTDVYTTGQVSKLCQVSQSTVIRWLDSGMLKGFRVPGSRHRRILGDNLRQFLKQHGIPVETPMLDAGERRTVLLVTRDQSLITSLRRDLLTGKSIKVVVASGGFDAGARAERGRPDCVVVDFAIGEEQGREICRNVQGKTAQSQTILIGILPARMLPPERQRLPEVPPLVFDETFQWPFDSELLAARVRTLLSDATR